MSGRVVAHQTNLGAKRPLDAFFVVPGTHDSREATPRKERRHFGRRIDWRIEVVGRHRGLAKRCTQRVANHDRLPAHGRHGEIEGLRKIEAGHVRRKENVWPDRRVEIRFADVACDAGDALANQVAGERLRRTLEIGLLIAPGTDLPARRRLLHRPPVGADEHRRQCAGHERVLKLSHPNRRVVRSPRVIPEHVRLADQHLACLDRAPPCPSSPTASSRSAAACSHALPTGLSDALMSRTKRPSVAGRTAALDQSHHVVGRVGVEPCHQKDVAVLVTERGRLAQRAIAEEIRIGLWAWRARAPPAIGRAVQERELRIDRRDRSVATGRSHHSQRDSLCQDDVEDAIEGGIARQPTGNRRLDTELIGLRGNRLGRCRRACYSSLRTCSAGTPRPRAYSSAMRTESAFAALATTSTFAPVCARAVAARSTTATSARPIRE